MDLSDAALRERARNVWPACLGLSPYNTIIEHGMSRSVTSRCCEFHEKLTALSIALRNAARAEQRERITMLEVLLRECLTNTRMAHLASPLRERIVAALRSEP